MSQVLSSSIPATISHPDNSSDHFASGQPIALGNCQNLKYQTYI